MHSLPLTTAIAVGLFFDGLADDAPLRALWAEEDVLIASRHNGRGVRTR